MTDTSRLLERLKILAQSMCVPACFDAIDAIESLEAEKLELAIYLAAEKKLTAKLDKENTELQCVVDRLAQAKPINTSYPAISDDWHNRIEYAAEHATQDDSV